MLKLKKLLVLSLGITLIGCGDSARQKIETKLEQNATNLNLIELGPTGWTSMRFIHPYKKANIAGQEFNNENNKACIWVFSNNEKVLESFEISREKIDCIELEDKIFSKNKAVFIIKKGLLQERKSFKK
jgi:hypothetical protein